MSKTRWASDTCFEDDLLNVVAAKTLLIVDRGFYHFLFWAQLQEKGVDVICRLKAGAAFTVVTVRFPGARIAPTTSTTADSHTLLENSGANSSIKLINSICSKFVMTFYIVLTAFL